MLIHQATYGEDRGGHALLAKSGDESSPFADVTWRTDLPGTAPSGVAWEPYVSGFPDHNYYVLAKTFPDPSASRGGMVFTHALFLPLADAVQLGDLGKIAALLPQQPSKVGNLAPLRMGTQAENQLSACRERGAPKGLGVLVEALLLGDKSPVVWVGQEGFEDAIFALWGQLPSEIRSAFTFRLSFGPQDTQDLIPTVVSTLAPLESRWAGYSTVHATEIPHNESDASKLLLGLPGGEKLRSFADEIQAGLVTLSDLKLLETCRRYADDQSLSGDGLLALARLLARLSPLPAIGVSVKRNAVERLTNKIGEMTAAEISSMRNLDVAAFADGDKVWTAVANWVQRNAGENKTATQMAPLVSQAAGADTPWTSAVWKGIDNAIAQQEPPLAASIWNWWQQDGALVEKLFARLPPESATENRLCYAFPEEIKPNLAKTIMQHAVGRHWYRLHGMAAASQFNPRDAVERQLAVDHDPAYLDGLKAALGRASSHDVVSTALQWRDSRIVTLAADACGKNTELLHDLVADDATWQEIWVGAISRNQEAWKGPSNPLSVMESVLDAVLSGGSIPEQLLDCLARTPLGDLSNYSRRLEIWQRFPTSCLQSFREKTADGWLSRFKKDVQFDRVVEPQLQSVLLRDPRLSNFLQSLIPADVAVGAHLFLRFSSLTEVQFDSWLITVERRVRNIAFPDARLLGRVVAARQWQRTAERMANDIRHYSRNDLKAALQECHQVLGLWEKVRLRFLGGVDVPAPTTDELWDLFMQTVVELYPKGPNDEEIWSRADGKESSLRHEGTGESRWRDALRLLRHRGGGDITAAKLLSEIRRDYAGNERIKWLIQQREFEDSHTD